MLSLKILQSALLLSEFTAVIVIGAGLIIADCVLLSYGIAKLIERIIWKP